VMLASLTRKHLECTFRDSEVLHVFLTNFPYQEHCKH
jgi:hypothetical protein